MKSIKLSIVILAAFSILLTIYFNTFSIAQSDESFNVKVESEIYKQVENNEKVRVIVNLRKNFDSEEITKTIKNSKNNIEALSKEFSEKQGEELKIIYKYEALNSLAIEADKKTIEALKDSKFVEEIFAEKTLEIQLQESLQVINATNAWNVQIPYGSQTTNLTGSGQVVCLIDTGVDYNHNALGAGWGTKVIGGWDFVNNDSKPMDDNGHGTHLAGIIAANGVNSNNQTIKGVAPDALIIAEKVCNSLGSCSNVNMIAGLDHCLTTIGYKKLSVVSMSIGDGQSYSSISGTCPTWMDNGINTAVSKGIPVIVSSGNQGYKNGISYPACSPNATSVGATYDKTVPIFNFSWVGVCQELRFLDKIACASNTGDNLKVVAPGAIIRSTAASNGTVCGAGSTSGTGDCSGTSQAAAHVAGAVALIRQKHYNKFPRNLTGTLKINRFLMKSQIQTTDPGNGLIFPRLSLLNLL